MGPVSGKLTGDNLDIGTPFYQDGQLQVHVYWQSAMGMFTQDSWCAICFRSWHIIPWGSGGKQWYLARESLGDLTT